ncbi:MAG: TIGR01620 family protein [Salinarimonas sp.]|nr:TIGR01620 family protein [Salinarimonas sp.]
MSGRSPEETKPSRGPKAWRFDDPQVGLDDGDADDAGGSVDRGRRRAVSITREPDRIDDDPPPPDPALQPRRRAAWGAILMASLAALVMLGVGIGIEGLIRELFARAPWLGWMAAAMALLAGIALVAIVLRELVGLLRERRIEHLRSEAARVLAEDDAEGAQALAGALVAFHVTRPGTARGREEIAQLSEAILEAQDRLVIVERALLAEADRAARRAVAQAARRVSVVTAVSPRALIDIAFVIYAAIRLLRRIAGIYGGRPGFFGSLRLARSAIDHLAVTGGVAMGDDMIQQVVGHGLAARLSTKLGEGVVNGAMTARFGLAAIAVCRPMPFIGAPAPRFGDVAGDLLSRRGAGEPDTPDSRARDGGNPPRD